MKHLFLFLTLICFSTAILASTHPDKGYEIGDKAENFTLKNVDGAMISLADYADNKGIIVIFTCNHCPYSVMYEDRINDLHTKYADMGYPVIAINPNDPEVNPADGYEEMKIRSTEKNFQFPYLFDEGQKIFPQFGATKTPHVFILDSEMTVKYIGAIDDNAKDAEGVEVNFVDAAITAMEAGNDPDPSFTKAIGCSIKTKKGGAKGTIKGGIKQNKNIKKEVMKVRPKSKM